MSACFVRPPSCQPIPGHYSRPPIGTLPRNRLAASATGGASALSPKQAPALLAVHQNLNRLLEKRIRTPPMRHSDSWSEWGDSSAFSFQRNENRSGRQRPRCRRSSPPDCRDRTSSLPFQIKITAAAQAAAVILVRVGRLELPASCSQSRRATNCANPGY